MDPFTLLVLHAAATLYLMGLIWTVQLVQYPLLTQLEGAVLRRIHAAHVQRITWAVGPMMIAEAALSIGIPAFVPSVPTGYWVTGLALLLVIWASTALIQVPLHGRLGGGDRVAGERLVTTNWIRTVAWTARAILALLMLAGAGSSAG